MAAILEWLVAFSDFVEHHMGAITAVIAAAAVFQWRETRRTAERQLRAYILQSTGSLYDGNSMDPKPFVDRTDQIAVSLEIKNFGQTPGSGIVHWCEMQVSEVSRESSIRPPEKLELKGPIILGPSGISTKNIWLNRALSTQERKGIHDGTYAVYVYGRVEYLDTFGTERWTDYKLRYTSAAWPPIGKGGASMSYCDSGNDYK